MSPAMKKSLWYVKSGLESINIKSSSTPSDMPSSIPSQEVWQWQPKLLQIVGETGRVVLSDTIDEGNVANISFRHEYTSPVVLAFINTQNGVESIAPRIKEVTATGCIIFMQEPDHQGHMAETVSYIVAEKGRYELDDGLIFEAGAIETDKGWEKGEIFEGDQITFSQSFQHPPAVLHSLNTHTNEDFTASLVTKITSHGFEIAQEYAETGGWNIVEETIAWIAFKTGS
eukprot:1925545-Ditylum_brightwellii.AAC.1